MQSLYILLVQYFSDEKITLSGAMLDVSYLKLVVQFQYDKHKRHQL